MIRRIVSLVFLVLVGGSWVRLPQAVTQWPSESPPPAEVARRYGLDDDLAAALESIDAVISAVVDR